MVQTTQNPLVASHLLVYCLLVLVGLIGALGDVTVNQWARSNQVWWWIISCFVWILADYAVWIITATIFTFLLRGGIFGRGVALFLVANIVFACLLGK